VPSEFSNFTRTDLHQISIFSFFSIITSVNYQIVIFDLKNRAIEEQVKFVDQ